MHASGLAIGPAERVLVTGPSGSGKTSLFRALGGVWPFGAGTIRIPQGAKLLVLAAEALSAARNVARGARLSRA